MSDPSGKSSAEAPLRDAPPGRNGGLWIGLGIILCALAVAAAVAAVAAAVVSVVLSASLGLPSSATIIQKRATMLFALSAVVALFSTLVALGCRQGVKSLTFTTNARKLNGTL